MLDKTFLNLTTILITGSGLFAVLTKFNVPELGMTYFNQNPFAVKKDAIYSVMTWLFTSFALFGLVIQVFKEIFGAEIPDRLYKPKIYVLFILETAEQGLLQIEKILELPLAQGTLKERIENLRPFFKKDSS